MLEALFSLKSIGHAAVRDPSDRSHAFGISLDNEE
jgi:hypothetical protein